MTEQRKKQPVKLRFFSGEFIFPQPNKPPWADSIARWHQLDAASFGLVQAYHEWKECLKKPGLIILASPLASNLADFDFVKSGAKSPFRMIHTLPSTRSSPLCQTMAWSGPVLCIQNDPATRTTGLIEGFGFVNEACPVVWVMSVMNTAPLHVTLFELNLADGASSSLAFPVATALLQEFLPHRPPMLWIDEVLWVGENEGECRVFLQDGAHYFDRKKVRASSFVEWMAQAYGFIRACQSLLSKPTQRVQKPEKTYLAAVSDIEFAPNMSDLLKTGDEIFIYCQTIRELGSLVLVQAEIRGSQKKVLARGQLKVFSE